MDSTQRKGINFDLDTEALKKHYPKGDWHNAYYDVRDYFVSICTISDVPELYDISHVFEREAQRLSEERGIFDGTDIRK